MLADALEADPDLRRTFFSELRVMLFGGARPTPALARPVATPGGGDDRRAPALRVRLRFDRGGVGDQLTPGGRARGWASACLCQGAALEAESPPTGAHECGSKRPASPRLHFDDPQRTADAFDEDGFLRMEDMADFPDRRAGTGAVLRGEPGGAVQAGQRRHLRGGEAGAAGRGAAGLSGHVPGRGGVRRGTVRTGRCWPGPIRKACVG